MSLSLYFRIGDSEFELPARWLDWTDRLGEENLRDCELLFGVEDVAESLADHPPSTADRTEMLAALDRLLHVAMTNEALFPPRFTFDFEIVPGVPVRGDDEVFSIVLPDREGFYMLSGGIDGCVLEKIDRDYDGGLRRSNPVDVSRFKSIESTSHGQIMIVKRNERGPVIEALTSLQRFLRTHFDATVEKRLA